MLVAVETRVRFYKEDLAMSMFDDFEHLPEHYEDDPTFEWITVVKNGITTHQKWQRKAPDSVGTWLMKCFEIDYEIEVVKVEFNRNELWAIDCAVGSLPVSMYHDGLIDCMWIKT